MKTLRNIFLILITCFIQFTILGWGVTGELGHGVNWGVNSLIGVGVLGGCFVMPTFLGKKLGESLRNSRK